MRMLRDLSSLFLSLVRAERYEIRLLVSNVPLSSFRRRVLFFDPAARRVSFLRLYLLSRLENWPP